MFSLTKSVPPETTPSHQPPSPPSRPAVPNTSKPKASLSPPRTPTSAISARIPTTLPQRTSSPHTTPPYPPPAAKPPRPLCTSSSSQRHPSSRPSSSPPHDGSTSATTGSTSCLVLSWAPSVPFSRSAGTICPCLRAPGGLGARDVRTKLGGRV